MLVSRSLRGLRPRARFQRRSGMRSRILYGSHAASRAPLPQQTRKERSAPPRPTLDPRPEAKVEPSTTRRDTGRSAGLNIDRAISETVPSIDSSPRPPTNNRTNNKQTTPVARTDPPGDTVNEGGKRRRGRGRSRAMSAASCELLFRSRLSGRGTYGLGWAAWWIDG